MPSNDFVLGLKCRVCGKLYPKAANFYCPDDSGPLEVAYDYDKIKPHVSRAKFAARPRNMWRYRELLPLDGEPTVGPQVGGTPLVRADRLADALGVERLWIKNDAVNFPTLSFKDRVVSVALSKAREFGMRMVGCASTGNLANSVAALGASAGLETIILVPADLEKTKIYGTAVYGAKVVKVSGTYDQVNRLCTQIVMEYGWGFVNVNLRPFYAEGSKTVGFEIAEDLGWRFPQHVVVPDGRRRAHRQDLQGVQRTARDRPRRSAGDDEDVRRAGDRLQPDQRLREGEPRAPQAGRRRRTRSARASRSATRPTGTSPRSSSATPAAGPRTCPTPRSWTRCSFWRRPKASSRETAGGTTLAVARKLIESGRIPRNEEIVICITGNGLKTQDAVFEALEEPATIKPSLAEFKALAGLSQAVAEPALV